MALKIRFRQQGKKNRQTFRLVLTDIRNKRDGKYLENLGWYNPCEAGNNASVNAERIGYWLDKGAEISEHAQDLVARTAPEVMKSYLDKREKTRQKRVAQRKASKKEAK